MMTALLLPSCSEELARPAPRTVKVSGKVMEGTIPVSGGWIEFTPLEGTIGSLRSAPIAPDGSFTVEGVGVGPNSVGLVNIKSTIPNARRMFDTLGTPIRRTVGPEGDSAMLIELYEEYARFQQLNRPAY